MERSSESPRFRRSRPWRQRMRLPKTDNSGSPPSSGSGSSESATMDHPRDVSPMPKANIGTSMDVCTMPETVIIPSLKSPEPPANYPRQLSGDIHSARITARDHRVDERTRPPTQRLDAYGIRSNAELLRRTHATGSIQSNTSMSHVSSRGHGSDEVLSLSPMADTRFTSSQSTSLHHAASDTARSTASPSASAVSFAPRTSSHSISSASTVRTDSSLTAEAAKAEAARRMPIGAAVSSSGQLQQLLQYHQQQNQQQQAHHSNTSGSSSRTHLRRSNADTEPRAPQRHDKYARHPIQRTDSQSKHSNQPHVSAPQSQQRQQQQYMQQQQQHMQQQQQQLRRMRGPSPASMSRETLDGLSHRELVAVVTNLQRYSSRLSRQVDEKRRQRAIQGTVC